MQKGGNMKEVFTRFCTGLTQVRPCAHILGLQAGAFVSERGQDQSSGSHLTLFSWSGGALDQASL
jgi:hypothetical protein